MPGLRLTLTQASRLWGLDEGACRRVVDVLVRSSFLRWTPGGTLARVGEESAALCQSWCWSGNGLSVVLRPLRWSLVRSPWSSCAATSRRMSGILSAWIEDQGLGTKG